MNRTIWVTLIAFAIAAALFIGRQAESNAQGTIDVPVQKTALDSLIEVYAQRKIDGTQVEAKPVDILEQEDTIKLRSEIIDLRVERDRLLSRNKQLQEQVESLKKNEFVCQINDCVSRDDTDLEKVRMDVVNWVHIHNMMVSIQAECPDPGTSPIYKMAEKWKEEASGHLRIMGIYVPEEGGKIDLDKVLTEIEEINARRP